MKKTPNTRGMRMLPVEQRGFALIACLSIMALMVMLIVGMLSLSAVEMKTSEVDRANGEARANARMALMMAIGELQKSTGPDQRVTAEADIYSEDGFTGWEASVDKKHYVGVYTTEKWHERDSSGVRESQKEYKEDRNRDAFERYLVSGEEALVTELDFAQSVLPKEGVVELVGEGTVGSTDPSDRVVVLLEDVKGSDGGTTGRLGWWVGDQGVKAKVNLSDKRELKDTDWELRAERMNPAQNRIDYMEGLEKLDAELLTDEQLAAMLSVRQFEVVNDDVASVRARYHDVTAYSRGVLADVALGGLKRDLSLPFELPSLMPESGATEWDYTLNHTDAIDERSADFQSIGEFSNSGDQNPAWASVYWPSGYRPQWWANKLGYVFAFPDSNGGSDASGMGRYLRGPTWQSLRNHYRQYKREYENLPVTDVSRRGWMPPSDERTWLAQPYQPYSHWHNSAANHSLNVTYVGGRVDGGKDKVISPDAMDPFYNFGQNSGRSWNNFGHNTLGLAPVFTRVGVVLSHKVSGSYSATQEKRIDLVLNAVGTLWNPYNVPIEFEAAFTSLELKGLRWNFTRIKTDGSEEELAIDPEQRSFGAEKYFPFQNFRVGVTAEEDPNYPFSSERPTKLIRLNPGESRTFALSFPEPKGYSWGSTAAQPGSFTNNWEGGMFLRFSNDWRVKSGEKYRFELLPQKNESIGIGNYLGYFEETKGRRANPFVAGRYGDAYKDLPMLSSVDVASASDILPQGQSKLTQLLSSFSNEQTAICALEFKLRAADTSPNGVLAQYDPRAVVNHSYSMGKGIQGDAPSNWEVNLALVSDFDLLQVGVGSRNNGFWGESHDGSGQTHVVAFEVPDAPLTNIAGLQHVQAGANAWDVSYAIGSSFPHPQVPKNRLIRQESTQSPEGYKATYYDMSYLANEGLWDRYFFTGMNFGGDEPTQPLEAAEGLMKQFLDKERKNPLLNKRLVLASSSVGVEEEALVKELTHYRWIARHLMLDGAMNINSTRVEAWKSWLGSLKGKQIDRVSETGVMSVQDVEGVAFSRAAVTAGDADELWKGYSKLNDQDIEKLAEKMVEEVRKRGPFLSVADFVNRRLSDDEQGEMGAVQAALKESGLSTGGGSELGVPGTIRQSDVLASIGGAVSARSDTFVIRAYGEALSPDGSGKVVARAWCEAVVQRTPLLVGDEGRLATKPNPSYPGSNPASIDAYIKDENASSLGRSYKIISFRWLNKDGV
ncbi:hypothetical protein [Rubritalea tangerina]|uniref:Verru_Chthon cassette protein A n=1 Tax=Rubritalea tangerina TaxID=430798 RepID=A0ABW4ZFC4_9BACT